jgi:hypothetical protein
MSLFHDSTAAAAADIRQRRMTEAAAHRQAGEAFRLRSRLSRSRRRPAVDSPRWQPVIAASVDLRCLRAD